MKRVVARDVGKTSAADVTKQLSKRFGPDALLQAARDRLELSEIDFAKVLGQELYADLKARLSPDDYGLFCDVLAASRPQGPGEESWKRFLALVQTHFPDSSAYALAKVLSESISAGCGPVSVLSFNAEPLIYSLVNALAYEKFASRQYREGPQPGELRQVFDRVTNSTSNRVAARIPYIFCHGLLPVPNPGDLHARAESFDKLVFSETEYSQLANSAFSWQSSVFIEACSTRHIVFVGVS